MKKIGRLRQAVILLSVALAHLLIFWSLDQPASHPTVPQKAIQWIEVRLVVQPLQKRPVPSTTAVARQPSLPSGSAGSRAVSSAVTVAPATEPVAAQGPEPPLDLSPEKLGSLLNNARRRDIPRTPAQSWRAAVDETPGSLRQSETAGASGSRVTRVDGPLGTYCIRSPQPGRPQPSGAGPELALPTNCP